MKIKWMESSSVLFILMFLYSLRHVHGTCGSGDSNKTVTVQCNVTKQIQTTDITIMVISPNCNLWSKFWDLFGDRCETKTRSEYKNVTENKTIPSQCESVICCPGFFLSANFCLPGCQNGTYGLHCNLSCSCPESAYSECDQDTGNCTCQAGLMGENCTETCSEGHYGDSCQQKCLCHNNATCDRKTGQCNCTEPGWTGRYCEESCNGTFGLNCSHNCTCNENQTCSAVDGRCQCKPGQTGVNCSNECQAEQFGIDCMNNCSCNSTTTDICDKVTGYCKCKPGFMGQNCSNICPFGFYGMYCSRNCTCIGTPLCDHKNGTCICLGKQGINCSEDCETLHYGPDCKSACECSGVNTNGSCDPFTGSCHCKPGWGGVRCSVEKYPRKTDEQNSRDEDERLSTDLIVGLIVGCCCLLVIISIIAILVCQSRRKRKFLNRPALKQYKNAIYSAAQESVVINEAKQHSQEELRNEIQRENASYKNIAGNEDNRKIASVQRKSNSTGTEKQYKNEIMDLITEKESIKMKDSVPKEGQENQENSDTYSDQVDYDVADMNSDIDSGEAFKDDDSVHYSDVESLSPGPTEQSIEKVDKTESVQNNNDEHEQFEEEQYDSLENDISRDVNRLPDYSSFEQVRKENESESEIEDSYDKVILSGQTKKNTLNRNDYNTVNAASKTVDKEPNVSSDYEQNSSVKNKKNSIPASYQNKQFDPIMSDNDSEYNILDHTGKSFISRAPENPYQSKEMQSDTVSERSNASVKVIKNDAKVEPSSEVKPESQNSNMEDSEYNTLDHTGKSFRVAHTPENIYHTKELLTKKDSDVNSISEAKYGSNVIESDLVTTETDDSEYNTLDHTGKSFRSKDIPDDIYSNKNFVPQLDTSTLVSVDIADPLTDTEDEGSYSVCDIDNVDSGDKGIGFTDDENSLYEIPDISEDDLKVKAGGTCASKVKPKVEQRRVDDYEHFDVKFGS